MPGKFTCYVLGEDSLLVKCSEALLERGHDICGIVSSSPTIKNWATRNNIETLELNNDLAHRLNSKSYDYLFSIANLSMLPDDVINSPRKCAINYHDGPLPRYAGINVPSWAIVHQKKTHGITWHEITSEVDKGDILKQVVFEMAKNETSLSLNLKCFESGLSSFKDLVDELASGTNRPIKQNFNDRTYFGKNKRPDQAAIINWKSSAEEISALVRALDFEKYANPLGLPKVKAGDEYFIIREIIVTDISSTDSPGVITSMNEEHVRVAAGTNEIEFGRGFSIDGAPLSMTKLIERYSLRTGFKFDELDDESAEEITDINSSIAKQEEYWVNLLSSLEFPDIHYAKKNIASEEVSNFKVEKINLTKEVLSFFRNLDQNPQTSLASAFGIFIGRNCGKNNFHIGYSDTELLENIKGYGNLFSEHVPLRVTFDPKKSFTNSLTSLAKTFEETAANKTYSRDVRGRYSALKQYIEGGGQSISPINIVFSENMEKYEAQSGSIVTLAVSSDLKSCGFVFDPSTIAEDDIKLFKAQFISFLEDAAADSGQKVAGISILSSDERNKLFEEWNNTEIDFPATKCIHQLFEEQVAKTPEATAIICKGKRLTYRELNERSNQVAHRLQKIGVELETLVGVCLYRSLDMVVAVMGVLKAGGAYVPLDPSFPKDRIAYMVEYSNCSVIITEEGLRDKLGSVNAHVITIDTEWNEISEEKSSNVNRAVSSENLSYVIYTSGSTGKPKGVMIEHRNVVNFITGMDACVGYDSGGTWLAVTSLSFDISVLEIFWTLARGFRVVIYPGVEGNRVSADTDKPGEGQPMEFDVNTDLLPDNLKHPNDCREASNERQEIEGGTHWIPELIKLHDVTHLQCTPSMASMLMLDDETPDAFGRLEKLLIGGEAFPATLAEQLSKVVKGDIINMYGPTETTVWSTTYRLNGTRQSIPIGRPIANTKIHILDKSLQPVPVGVPGELMIGGAGVVRGYFKRPDLTAERFIRNPFTNDPESRLYRTGDLARYLPDGNIEFMGRMDHQVKIRGYRIELGEIEAVLNDHPTVHESVVIAREDVPGRKRLVAYVIPRKGESPRASELRAYAKEKLPGYMVPAHVVRLKAFPQTPNKKIDRKALPPPGKDRLERGASYDPPHTDIEEAVARIWAEALGVQPIGRSENFFDLGGDSVSACGITLSIQQACNVALPLQTIFRAPTVAALSEELEEAFRSQAESGHTIVELPEPLQQKQAN